MKFQQIKQIISILILLFPLASVAARGSSEVVTTPNEMVIALGSDPEHLNPGISTGYPVAAATANVYSALVWRNADGEPEPDLARSWDVSADNRVFTFHLREGVRWHDGTPFTSADVKFSMEEVLAPNHGRFTNIFERISSIDTPNDTTVVITLEQPYAPFLISLTVFDAPILPRHILQGQDVLTHQITTNPVGTGPYRFVEWDRGSRIVLERNSDYFEDPARIERIIFRIIPDDSARATAVETGDVDYLWGFYLPVSEVDNFRRMDSVEVWQGVRIPALYFLFVNNDNEPLDNPLVRRALMHAIDRELIVELTQEGFGNTAISPLGGAFPYVYDGDSDLSTLYPFDLARARQLLQEAGVGEFELTIVYDSGRPAFSDLAEILRNSFSQIGVTLNLQPQERSVMLSTVYGERDYDLSMQSFTSGGDPSIGYHRIYITQEFGSYFVSATGYSNAQVDDLLQRAGTTVDLAERARLYSQVSRILAADLPLFALYEEESFEVNDARLRGLRQSLDVRDQLHRAFWAE